MRTSQCNSAPCAWSAGATGSYQDPNSSAAQPSATWAEADRTGPRICPSGHTQVPFPEKECVEWAHGLCWDDLPIAGVQHHQPRHALHPSRGSRKRKHVAVRVAQVLFLQWPSQASSVPQIPQAKANGASRWTTYHGASSQKLGIPTLRSQVPQRAVRAKLQQSPLVEDAMTALWTERRPGPPANDSATIHCFCVAATIKQCLQLFASQPCSDPISLCRRCLLSSV